MLAVNGSPSFQWQTTNNQGRPGTAMGTVVTPAQNSMGSWASLLASTDMLYDAYGVMICINNNAVSAAARDTVIDIGVDPAGGTSYSVVIPTLLGSCAGSFTFGGVWYYFPLRIPAGSSVAARAAINNATVGTLNVYVRVLGRPRRPEFARFGTYVEAIGYTSASSSGKTIVSGSTTIGAWTNIGTTTKDNWWWQLGFGVNDSTMTNLNYVVDLGINSGAEMLLGGFQVITDPTERLSTELVAVNCEFPVPAGTVVQGRSWCSGSPDSALSLIAYGLGG